MIVIGKVHSGSIIKTRDGNVLDVRIEIAESDRDLDLPFPSSGFAGMYAGLELQDADPDVRVLVDGTERIRTNAITFDPERGYVATYQIHEPAPVQPPAAVMPDDDRDANAGDTASPA